MCSSWKLASLIACDMYLGAGGGGRMRGGRGGPFYTGQGRRDGLTAPKAAGRSGLASVLLLGLCGKKNGDCVVRLE